MKNFRYVFTTLIITLIFSSIALLCSCSIPKNPSIYNVSYTASEGGYIIGETEQSVDRGKDARSVTAISNEGYEFIKWSDGVTTPERQDKNVKENISVRADFQKRPDIYTVIYSASKGGYIEGKIEQEVEYGNDAEAVVAVPESGFKFAKWSDGVTTPERQDKIVKADISVKAEFQKKPDIYTVLYSASEGGYIEGKAEQKVEQGNYTEFVVAVPQIGYKFVKWSDGYDSPVRQDFNVTSTINVTAEFIFLYAGGDGSAVNPFTITNYTQLKAIWYYPDANYKLLNDLDLSGISHEPIFDGNNCFKGKFDGANHKLSNLTVETESNYPSLFGVIEGGIVGNLTIKDASIKTTDFNTIEEKQKYCVGIVAGKSLGFIYNVSVSGIIVVDGLSSDGVAIGGLIGLATGTIADCYCDIQINIKHVFSKNTNYMQLPFVFGGMIGVCNSAYIRSCNVEGKINVTECSWYEDGGLLGDINKYTDIMIGGMVGYYFTDNQVNTYARDCKTDIVIYGDNHFLAGGFIGSLDIAGGTEFSIYDSSVHGDIEIGTVGGFICEGYNSGELLVENCYVKNSMTSFSCVSGFVQNISSINNKCIIKNCYSDSILSTHRIYESSVIVGEASGFAYQVMGINFLGCYSSGQRTAKRCYGFAWELLNCNMEQCYAVGKMDTKVINHTVSLFVSSLMSSRVFNCYSQINLELLSDNESIPVIEDIVESEIKSFYYAGNAATQAICWIEDSVVENFHMLKISDQEMDLVGSDTGKNPSTIEIFTYGKEEEMYFLADKLNENLSEELWVNVPGDYPQFKS